MTRFDVLVGLLKAKNTSHFIELTYEMAHREAGRICTGRKKAGFSCMTS